MKNTENVYNNIKVKGFLSRFKYEIYLTIVSVFALIVHIHLASTLNLGNDEAHYYVWSLKPSLGYLDDAPFVGWIIYVFTELFGKSQLSVRLGAVIFSFLDGFLIYYLSYLLFKNKRAAFFAFLFFLSAVIFGMVLSVMMLPDAPLLFFTLCFFIFFYKAVEKGTDFKSVPFSTAFPPAIFWLLAGLSLGFAFLSKYTAALIPPSALLYLFISKRNRSFLKTFYPYMTLAVAILVFLPVIYWNFTHNFISFKFQLSHGFSHPKPGFPLLAAGWFGQVLVITPFIYLFLIGIFVYIMKKGTREKKEKRTDLKSAPFSLYGGIHESILFSVCFSLPMLLFFLVDGYSHIILLHWPDIGYLAAFPVMGYVADILTREKLRKKGTDFKSVPFFLVKSVPFFRYVFPVILKYYVYFALFSGFFLSFVLYNQIYYNSIPTGKIIRYIDKEKRLKKDAIFSLIPHIPGKPSTADITNDLFGWKYGAKYINIIFKGYKAVYHPLFILTHHYAIADELVYYNCYKPAVNIYNISGFLNQYDLWQNLNKINGENALFIMDNKYMINPVQKYAPFFKSIKKIGRLDIYVKFRLVRIYYLYLMKDFNGGKAIKRIKVETRMY